ncbi:MAG: bifunctional 2-polyprenyl-6-hydroxyphenol methylase/3-demethylubiquinol 3-O-methyltransferase UbiG [Hyphomicrobiales bacterium]
MTKPANKTAAQSAPEVPTSVVEEELKKFSDLAAQWWDPEGKFKTLHKFNPVRLGYIREHACAHFGLDRDARTPFTGLRLLDIGCGGGLLCEPMARLGAEVVGADAAEKNVRTAAAHAREHGLDIDYRATTAEDLVRDGELFDIVLNMEVVEHVADVGQFIASCASLVRPGGLMYVATLNRTLKAFALAIVGAEYVLGWLPRGTHQWEKFVTPAELSAALGASGMRVTDRTGVAYNPLADAWRRTSDTDVNYLMLAAKPEKA